MNIKLVYLRRILVLIGVICNLSIASTKTIDFYGRPISFIKMFGQRNWKESTSTVTDHNIYHAAGVAIDRHKATNAIYIIDSGNNRILGMRDFASGKADMVFGQPDMVSSAANGDCNLGMFGPTTPTNLCLMAYPVNTNFAEQWLHFHIDVGINGNLYVVDSYNNRVLVYNYPFSTDKSNGKGDNIPDLVIGQKDFNQNGVNQGRGKGQPNAKSLYLAYGGFDHVSARGVSVDIDGNVWVADTFNYRVLRFPPGSSKADLVLGQSDFTSCRVANNMNSANLSSMCTPTIARVNPENGELYVADEYPRGFPGRILIFKPPFRNGMAADRILKIKQISAGDYASGYRPTHLSGLAFNTFKTDDWIDPEIKSNRYRDGVVWINDINRCMLLDKDGNILLGIGAPDTITRGGRYDMYSQSGLSATEPYNLVWPGGSLGFDTENNICIADEANFRICRYALPYRTTKTKKGRAMPADNGGLFPARPIDGVHWRFDRVGMTIFQNQLIVRDYQRYMVWTNYLEKTIGAPADLIIGQKAADNIDCRNSLVGRSHHTIDAGNRLWSGSEHGKLIIYQLPFVQGAEPLRQHIPLYWLDAPDVEINYRGSGVAYDSINSNLWVLDSANHRLLRVSNPEEWNGKLLVDSIIGQNDKVTTARNRGASTPDASSLGDVNSIRFDNLGNLYVVDNTYEGHPNGRVITFMAEDLAKITNMFSGIQAQKVYSVKTFNQTNYHRINLDQDHPFSPVSVAFSHKNEMVIGNDGYYRDDKLRPIRQLYLYRNPLKKTTPDAIIELPMGAPAEMQFDAHDNLIVLDHTANKVWVINYNKDPAWLK